MSFRRVLLAVLAVLVVSPVLAALWLLHTESGARFAWQHIERALDGALEVDRVSGTLSGGLEIDTLRYRDDSVSIHVDRSTLQSVVNFLPLGVTVRQARIDGVRIGVEPRSESQGADSPSSIGALDYLALPIVLRIDDLAITDIEIDGIGETQRVLHALRLSARWQEALTATLAIEAPDGEFELSGMLGFAPPYAIDAAASVALTDEIPTAVAVAISGRVDDYSVNASADTLLEDYGRVVVELDANGTLDDLSINSATLTSDDVDLRTAGRVAWADGLEFDAAVEIARAQLHRFVAAWPRENPLSGRVELGYASGRLAIESLDLAVAGTPMTLKARAVVEIDAETVQGEVQWSDLAWPVAGEAQRIASPDGAVAFEGTLADWRAVGSLALDAPQVEPGRFELAVEGGRTSMRFRFADAVVLGGRLSGDGTLSWTDQRLWSASVDFDDIRTDSLLPDTPGRLSGHVDASGSAEPFAFEAALQNVRGQLAGQAAAAEGRLSLSDGIISASNLSVRHGANEVTLNGSPYTTTGLVFSAYVSDLSNYMKVAAGEVRAGGRAGLRDGIPWLSMTAASDRLTFGELEVLGFRIDDLAPAVDTRSRLRLSATEISMAGQQVLSPRVEVNVTALSQSLSVNVGYEGLRFNASIVGALDSFSEPSEWVGAVDALEFSFESHPPVELSGPASVRVARGELRLDRLCLREPGGAALCAAAAWREGGRTDASAVLTSMPVQMVNALADTRFSFDQTLSGEFEWHSGAVQAPTGRARLVMSPGQIQSIDRTEVVFETAEATFEFDIVDGQLLSGKLDLPMPGTGGITGEMSVLDVASPLESELTGSVRISVRDIGAIAALSPLIDEASGEVNGDITIGGQLGDPILTGNVEFRNGGLGYDPLGILLTDINVSGELRGDLGINIDGAFKSGEGHGTIQSRHENGLRGGADLFISGTGLRLVDVPDVTATANLDLGVGFSDGTLAIDGRILIPSARITPASLPAKRDTVSADAVVVNGELPEQSDEETSDELRITGSLDVELGDDVSVDLGIAKASITGRTVFTWTGDPLPMADGRFDLRGQIQAFGQPLSIASGGVRFPNVEASNPELRLRAEREIFGNSQVKTAGVLVSGTVARPKIAAYTVPETTEERALTLLVTGSDFDLEQGVGAVDFGTYIAPRLYVSYGIGIFDRDNIISARYDLIKGFGIRATSGQRGSGLDAIYRFER